MENDTTNDWKRLNSKRVYSNPWIDVFHEDVINPNGGKTIYGRVHFKNIAIGILVIDDDNHTWLVGQKRYPIDAYTWEIPEGGAPLHENPLDAAKRELAEEVQLKAESWTIIQEADLSNSATDERTIIYLARNVSPCTDYQRDNSENLSINRVHINEFLSMVDEGTIRDSLSVIAALKYRVMMKQ